jgi:hypothetical protein
VASQREDEADPQEQNADLERSEASRKNEEQVRADPRGQRVTSDQWEQASIQIQTPAVLDPEHGRANGSSAIATGHATKTATTSPATGQWRAIAATQRPGDQSCDEDRDQPHQDGIEIVDGLAR